MIPDFVTHYYLPDRPPFLSLSDLDGDVEHPVFAEMLNKHKRNLKYQRRFGRKYLETRKETESKLRRLFEALGGKPKLSYPIYFILGDSEWFRCLNLEHDVIRIALSELPKESTSVTFPDSFLAMSNKAKPYFEKVYFLDEIEYLVDEYGLPSSSAPSSYEKYWEGDFEHYIEVQVWDDKVVAPYRRQWNG